MTPADLTADMQAGYALALAYKRHELLLAGAVPHENERVDLFVLLAIARRA